MFKKIKMWFEKRKCDKKSPTENVNYQSEIEIVEEKEENSYVSITIDGKSYDTSNQEEIAEILKYFSEQLRAKK